MYLVQLLKQEDVAKMKQLEPLEKMKEMHITKVDKREWTTDYHYAPPTKAAPQKYMLQMIALKGIVAKMLGDQAQVVRVRLSNLRA